MKGDRPPRPEDWTDLVDEVRSAGDRRVLVSSEFLCYADDTAAKRVVTEIAGGPVHVVITLRSIAKIAPSQWQQYVQNGLRVPYLDWLDGMFRRPPYDKPTPSFWRRHSHGELVRRWAEAAGPENLTVVVADESDPDMLLRTFEAFLGLPEGLMVSPQSSANRSLSRGEIELVRTLNERFHQHGWAEPWTEELHADVVRHGVVRKMKTGRRPASDEPRLVMPDWAAARAAEVGSEIVETIKSLDVRVIGDLSTLAEVPAARRGTEAELRSPAVLTADAATLAVYGAMNAAGGKGEGTKVAAALAVIGAMNAAGNEGVQQGVAVIGVDAVARAVLAATDTGDKWPGFGGLPLVSARSAAAAVEAAASASADRNDTFRDIETNPGFTSAHSLFDVLGVHRNGKKPTKAQVSQHVPVEKQTVEKVAASDLLRVIAQRGSRRLRSAVRR